MIHKVDSIYITGR